MGPALRWKLARNKMALARLGADTVPLELFSIPPLEEGCSMDAPAEDACE